MDARADLSNCIKNSTEFIKKRVFFLKYIFIISLAISSIKSYGQNISEIEQSLKTMKMSSDVTVKTKAAHLDNLLYDVQPTIYLTNNQQTVYGKISALNIVVDAQSLNKLKESNPLFNKVELISIIINTADELNFVIDISTLQSFENLKYIRVQCNFELDPNLLNNMFLNSSNINIYYISSKNG